MDLARSTADSNSIEKRGTRLFAIPTWCYWVGFVFFDIISLAIQTVGGVEVSSANNLDDINHGGGVMRAGIIFQLSNTALFTVLVLATTLQIRKSSSSLVVVAGRLVMAAMCVSTLMLLLRNGYRIVELSDGWQGHVMRTESYLIGLDMAPMAVAIFIFLLLPPSMFLSPRCPEKTTRSLTETMELGGIP
jgi:hypothetical protein